MQAEPIEQQVDIDADPQTVFDFLRDYARASEWQPDALEVDVQPPGLAAVGTEIQMKRRTPFGAQSFTVEITDLDEASRTMKDRAKDGTFAGTVVEFAVDDLDGKSRVRIRMSPQVQGRAATFLRVGFLRTKMMQSVGKTWSDNLGRLATQMKES